jgi:hypothetical protein
MPANSRSTNCISPITAASAIAGSCARVCSRMSRPARPARPANVRARAERALALLREEKLIASAMGRGHFVIRGG